MNKQAQSESSRNHRIVVIGLDAYDPHLLENWSKEGHLPFMSSLIKSNSWIRLKSTADLSGDSVWPSFYSGASPAKHGIYNFTQLKPGTHNIFCLKPQDCLCLPFWHFLKDSGKRVVTFDVPITYPLDAINGIQIAAWGDQGPWLKPVSIPGEIIGKLNSRFGKYKRVEEIIEPDKIDQELKLCNKLTDGIKRKLEASKYIMDGEDWNLFISVFGESHIGGHQFLHHSLKNHWAYDGKYVEELGTDPLLKIYSAIDSAIASLFENISTDTTFFILSVHGMVTNYSGNHLLPEVLTKLGFLVPASEGVRDNSRKVQHAGLISTIRSRFPDSIRDSINKFLPLSIQEYLASSVFSSSINWDKSKAFALPGSSDLGWIVLNAREGMGVSKADEEYNSSCEKIRVGLMKLINPGTGRRAVDSVLKVREMYKGDHIHHLPDLVVHWAEEAPIVSLSHPDFGTVSGDGSSIRKTQHGHEGFLIVGGRHIRQIKTIKRASIMDIAPTILYLMKQPISKTMDGKALLDLIEDDFRKTHSVIFK